MRARIVDKVEAVGLVEGVHVTPGVAAVLATQFENSAVRKLVRRHGALALATAVGCWVPIQEGRLQSRDVGECVGIGEHDSVTATNALRAGPDCLELDPYLAEIPVPDPGASPEQHQAGP